jgi:hypothetical protein
MASNKKMLNSENFTDTLNYFFLITTYFLKSIKFNQLCTDLLRYNSYYLYLFKKNLKIQTHFSS